MFYESLAFNEGGNDGFWRFQLRDKYGRWIKMGGSAMFEFRKPNDKNVYKAKGTFQGNIRRGWSIIRVGEGEQLPPGDYEIDSRYIESIKAIINTTSAKPETVDAPKSINPDVEKQAAEREMVAATVKDLEAGDIVQQSTEEALYGQINSVEHGDAESKINVTWSDGSNYDMTLPGDKKIRVWGAEPEAETVDAPSATERQPSMWDGVPFGSDAIEDSGNTNYAIQEPNPPAITYHVAPRSAREDILNNGLDPKDETWNTGVGGGSTYRDEHLWETGDDGDEFAYEYRPVGVYMFPTLEQAQAYAGNKDADIYEIDTALNDREIIRDPSSALNWDFLDEQEKAYVTRYVDPTALKLVGEPETVDSPKEEVDAEEKLKKALEGFEDYVPRDEPAPEIEEIQDTTPGGVTHTFGGKEFYFSPEELEKARYYISKNFRGARDVTDEEGKAFNEEMRALTDYKNPGTVSDETLPAQREYMGTPIPVGELRHSAPPGRFEEIMQDGIRPKITDKVGSEKYSRRRFGVFLANDYTSTEAGRLAEVFRVKVPENELRVDSGYTPNGDNLYIERTIKPEEIEHIGHIPADASDAAIEVKDAGLHDGRGPECTVCNPELAPAEPETVDAPKPKSRFEAPTDPAEIEARRVDAEKRAARMEEIELERQARRKEEEEAEAKKAAESYRMAQDALLKKETTKKKKSINPGFKNWNSQIGKIFAVVDRKGEFGPRGDVMQATFIEKSGFNGKPQVLSQAEFDALEGETIYRGVTFEGMVTDYIESEVQYAGQGSFGNGTYNSNLKETAETYASGSGPDAGDLEARVMEMKLLPDANVLLFEEVPELREWATQKTTEFLEEYKKSGANPAEYQEAEWKLFNDGDWTNIAIMLGIDAVRFKVPLTDKEEYYTITLNRGKVAINGKS